MDRYNLYMFYSFNGICGNVYDSHDHDAHATEETKQFSTWGYIILKFYDRCDIH